MKVTVCELNDQPQALALDWAGLRKHVTAEKSDLVLLPEMPFYPWLATTKECEPSAWQTAVDAHDAWIGRLGELAVPLVLGSRPISNAGQGFNEGFAWLPTTGYQAVHHKVYLPDEDGFWEASWYNRGAPEFVPARIRPLSIGFLICTELWFFQYARMYGKLGVNLIVNPRTTERRTVEKWLVGGRTAAIVSGAYCLSSNRVSPMGSTPTFGGQGWVVGPDGEVLALTSADQPFISVEIDLQLAELAKHTYPRYVIE